MNCIPSSALLARTVLLGLCAAITGCGSSDPVGTFGGGDIGAPRVGCTPFGNVPRPRNDQQTVLENTLLSCIGGTRLPDWLDPNGTPRAACLYDPGTASAQSPLPLVVYLQSSSASAGTSLIATNILPALATADLTGDPARPGFLLLAPAGRVTDRFYVPPNDSDTNGWDVWYRQFGSGARTVNGQSYALNADFAALDHFIAEQVATGKVDAERVYLFGWSNGAALALQYGQNRSNVSAVAMYSAPDPYDALSDPCPQRPVRSTPDNDIEVRVSNPGIPVFHIQNSCDIYATCPNGVALRDTLMSSDTADIRYQLINGTPLQQAVDQCDASCGVDPRGSGDNVNANTVGDRNHKTWPTTWTDDWFAFLRDHPG